MQERHKNRAIYFRELAQTSKNYFIPYLQRFTTLSPQSNILEIGCGDGGNLLPFARMGCQTTGVDMAEGRINGARTFFKNYGVRGKFITADIFDLSGFDHSFDVIICHDVIEHIGDKQNLLLLLSRFLNDKGVIFMSFPAWQMPFGGHQQICRNSFVSHLPFIHLLPQPWYRGILHLAGEDEACIRELMSIRKTHITVELFERLVKEDPHLTISDRTLYLINPHYEAKFGLKPYVLPQILARLPYIRNFFTTSCFYILTAAS